MQKNWLLFLVTTGLCFLTGCGFYDYERSESQRIAGNFYVVNLHLEEHPGFYLVYKQGNGHEQHFLGDNESIDYLKANDSIILVRTKPDPDTLYYLIEHRHGDTVLGFKKLSDNDFYRCESGMVIQKIFEAEK